MNALTSCHSPDSVRKSSCPGLSSDPELPAAPGWPVIEIERLISQCGLKVVDHPARADLEQRYFAGRADGLRPYNVETLVTARIA